MSGTIKAIYFSKKNNESDFPKYLHTIDVEQNKIYCDQLWFKSSIDNLKYQMYNPDISPLTFK